MEIDAISLCVAQFGISREEAARYVEPREGWQAHETASPAPGSGASPDIAALLAALAPRYGSNGQGASGSRRNIPAGVKEVPASLVEARKAAGLCVKCGVRKYEPGSKGHNSRTCQAPADKTTSATDGKRAAGF